MSSIQTVIKTSILLYINLMRLFAPKIFNLRIIKYTPSILPHATRNYSVTINRTLTTIHKSSPTLKDFIEPSVPNIDLSIADVPYLTPINQIGEGQKVYFEIYGCQMNLNDAEIAWSILKQAGYERAETINNANVILLVTCAIRENAETKIFNRLNSIRDFRSLNPNLDLRIGLLGCMAEHLKDKLLENDVIDIIAGPDSYRDLPRLLSRAYEGRNAINVALSADETYADIAPIRFNRYSTTSAFVSIMRGCNNMCSFCVVPFTRGRERSRPLESILNEIRQLSSQGVKEVTLLGQNVNSYQDMSQLTEILQVNLSRGFSSICKQTNGGRNFTDLLDKVSLIDSEIRVRFISPHPKDFPDDLLDLIKERPNICKDIHLPLQSGSSSMLQRMRRGHTREAYLKLVEKIREKIPEVSLSTDVITGFCDETQEEHDDTLQVLETVKFDQIFFFAYSMRSKTHAYHQMTDNIPKWVKKKRLNEIQQVFDEFQFKMKQRFIGTIQLVLVNGRCKKLRNSNMWMGLNDAGIVVEFKENDLTITSGEYIGVKIDKINYTHLEGTPLFKSSIQDFYSN